METVYSNQYGSIALELITEYVPVSSFRSSQSIVKENSFDVETAEKITLLTEHIRTQVCFHYPFTGLAYLLLHNSPDKAALCKVSNIKFECTRTAQEQIEYCHKRNNYYSHY